jgi:hypothetical protein
MEAFEQFVQLLRGYQGAPDGATEKPPEWGDFRCQHDVTQEWRDLVH